jgi:hypothetical protein
MSLLVAVLAGLGAAELSRGTGSLLDQRRNLSRGGLVLIAFLGSLWLGLWMLSPGPLAGLSTQLGLVWGFVWLLAAVVVTRITLRGRLVGLRLAVSLTLLVGIDLVVMDSSLVERFPIDTSFAEDVHVANRLVELGGRVYAPSFRPSPHIAGEKSLRIVNGVDPLQSAEYAQFLNAAAGVDKISGYSVTLPPLPDGGDPSTALVDAEPDPLLLSTLDVRGIVSAFSLDGPFARLSSSERQGQLEIYRNDSTIPWPVIYHRAEVVQTLQDAIGAVRMGRLEERAVVRGGYPLDGPAGYEPATLILQAPNRLLVKAKGPGLLVVSEVAYPGWTARVDGEITEIYPANGVLRGVYLSGGEHTVEMRYQPPAVFWGLGISIVSLGGLAAGSWNRRRG